MWSLFLAGIKWLLGRIFSKPDPTTVGEQLQKGADDAQLVKEAQAQHDSAGKPIPASVLSESYRD